jgi:hypothetical protein
MNKNRKSCLTEKKGQRKSNQPPPAKNPKADFEPIITDETAPGNIEFGLEGNDRHRKPNRILCRW